MEHDHSHAAHPDPHAGHDHGGPEHDHAGPDRAADARRLKWALGLILAFMVAEVVVAIASRSLALLSDAAHMLTDAGALALALVAARLASRPARGRMTFGLGRAEILSAQANGLTMLVLALIIVYGAIAHLISPSNVRGWPVLIVALVGIVVNVIATRILGGEHHGHSHGHGPHRQDPAPTRSLNVEGSYRHLLTDLFGFIATAAAAAVILITGWTRADAIASLLIAVIMLAASWGLLKASARVMMEAAPEGLSPDEIGLVMAAQPGVDEVHDLHIWEVTSGFSTISAHVVVACGHDCHEVRQSLSQLLVDRFALEHSTLQVEHTQAPQPPMQIEVLGGRELQTSAAEPHSGAS